MIPLCLRTARSNGHSDTFSSNFFSKPLGILDTEGIKIIIIIIIIIISEYSANIDNEEI